MNPVRTFYILGACVRSRVLWGKQASKIKGLATMSCSAKRSFLAILAAACSMFCIGCDRKSEAPPPPPPVEVDVIEVTPRSVPIIQSWVASTEGMVNAKIRAQVAGYLVKQHYVEGSLVRKGDLLFEIDDRPFKAALDQAKGDLAQAQARLAKTTLDVDRYTPLAAESAISQQELDDAVQAKAAALASVDAANAVVEQAQFNLGFTRITSLIDGVAGFATAQIGDLVGPTTAELTTVSTVDPIKVFFTVSEQEYLDWKAQFANDQEMTDREQKLVFELVLANGTVWHHKGRFLFADRQVNVRTGSLTLAAEFPNPTATLRPGLFGRIRTVVKEREGSLLVPQRAVIEVQGTYQLAFVVEKDDKKQVEIRPVKVGRKFDSDWLIESGIEEGDTVIVEGVTKVRPGTVVNPRPFVSKDDAKPKKPKAKKPAKPDESEEADEAPAAPVGKKGGAR